MIATNAGQAAVAAGLLARRARNGRTVKPCGPVPPTLGTSFAKQVSLDDGGYQARHPGESTEQP
jgi:hypothetical protein